MQYAHKPFLVPVVYLTVETGMRQGEAAGLLWQYIDLKHCVAHLPMTESGEAVRAFVVECGSSAGCAETRRCGCAERSRLRRPQGQGRQAHLSACVNAQCWWTFTFMTCRMRPPAGCSKVA